MCERVVDLMEESDFSDTVSILAISKLTVKKYKMRCGDESCLPF